MKKLLFLLIIFLTSCSNITPHPRDTLAFNTKIKSFEPGKATKQDFLNEIGEPDSIMFINGQDVWVYWRQQISLLDLPFYTYYSNKKIQLL